MKIHELLERDPRTIGIANDGQARIRSERTDAAAQELRQELESFVCDGEYGRALERVLSDFLEHLRKPRQSAAWISGFYGSGKSHLLKMLGHLWVDTAFPNGVSARTLVRGLPEEVQALLRELDTQAARAGVPLLAPAGTLPSGSGEHVRATILSIILDACDLPIQYPQAEFVFWARENSFEQPIRTAVEAAGKIWPAALNDLYTSPVIAQAIMSLDRNFATSEAQARETLRTRFPGLRGDLTTPQFITAARKALAGKGGLPFTLLLLDEAQQYIADIPDRAKTFVEAVEAIKTQLDARVMIVASGQSALAGTPNLVWLRDRFPITRQLSDADVEAVTRKVLLRKKETAKKAVTDSLARNAGEVSRHLSGSRIASRTSDDSTALADYPLLPSRRRFWEECFRVLDAQGTQSQLRSQLKILHEALRGIGERDLGAVIPADVLFDAISASLVNTGVLLNEINTRIAQLEDGTPESTLRRRICGLVFMIGRMPREQGVDVGVRATPAMLADLLVDDISVDSGRLRTKVEVSLKALAANGTLMQVGDEYRLQTTEGAEWDRAFRERLATASGSAHEVESKRLQLFGAEVQSVVGQLKLNQGTSKTPRSVRLHSGLTAPPSVDGIVIWLRDAWSAAESDVMAEARTRGLSDATVHLYLPRRGADELTKAIAEMIAAQGVLDQKGATSTDAGRDARQNMHTRLEAAKASASAIVKDIVRAGKVLQGGGTEVFDAELLPKLQRAAEQSCSRLYPQFGDADHTQWEVVIRRARDGNEDALKVLGWNGPTHEHPVSKEVLKQIGAGSTGTKIWSALKIAPFGWPKDAVDGALIALHRAGVVRVTKNGNAIAPGQLDQAGVAAAEFRTETVVVPVADKLSVRGLIASLGISVKAGDEESKCGEYLDRLSALVDRASGPAPAPAPLDQGVVNDCKALSGGARLVGIAQWKDALTSLAERATKQADLIDKRRPAWARLERFLTHASALAGSTATAAEVEAIRTNRSLIASPDPVEPLVTKLANDLRAELNRRHQSLIDAVAAAQQSLNADASWTKLSAADRARLLDQCGLAAPQPLAVKSDDELLAALDTRSLSARSDAAAAVSRRVADALLEAVRILQPKAQPLKLKAVTLSTEAEVKAWIADHESTLLGLVSQGPVTIG